MIDNSKRLEHISEYYFSKKLREVKSLIDKGKDIVNLGIGSPDLFPPENSIEEIPLFKSRFADSRPVF